MADRKISELTALTAPASGDYVPIVDISEPTAANRNKRITLDVLTSYFRTDGVFSSALGTAATPSITFTGDPNTGIYSPGADEVAISTNGTERVIIGSNVGIGTTNPYQELTLRGTSEQLLFDLNTTTNGIYGSLAWNGSTSDQGTGNYSAEIRGYREAAGAYGALGFHTRGTSGTSQERLRIDSSGRLLVGTSSDSGGALLQVNGDRVRIATAKTPASASDTGTAGEICWDANYIYVCTATDTWKRTAISTW